MADWGVGLAVGTGEMAEHANEMLRAEGHVCPGRIGGCIVGWGRAARGLRSFPPTMCGAARTR